jgi:hypothetical protein
LGPATWAQAAGSWRPASRTPTRPGFPAKLAAYTPKDSAEAAVLRLLTDRSEGLGACKGGQPGHVRIIATGPLPKGQGIWMIAARPPLPTEQRLCWMFAFGNDRDLGAPVAHLGKPPPLTSLVASSSGDPSKLVIDGYVTKQAARVRLILAGGNLPSTWSRCRAAARSRSTSSLRCFPGQGPRSSSRWSGSSPWTATGGQSPRAGLGLASQAAAASADAAAATGPRR